MYEERTDTLTTRGTIHVEMRDDGTTIPGDEVQRRDANENPVVLNDDCRAARRQVLPRDGILFPHRRRDDPFDKRKPVR